MGRRVGSRLGRRAALAAAGALTLALPGAGPARACDLALALAHDVSHSVSRAEYALQTRGHAAAFRDPEIQALIEEIGGVSVMLLHWSGARHQELKIPWRRLTTAAEIDRFADELGGTLQTVEGFGTAVGDALDYLGTVWGVEVGDCSRMVIDLSGDGAANEGQPVAPPRARLIAAGVTINGLAIRRRNVPLNDGIQDYYRREVIGGAGAFAMQAEGFDDYARAFRQKLLRELRRPAIASAGRFRDGRRRRAED